MSRLLPLFVDGKRDRGSVIFIHGLGGDPYTTWGGKTIAAPHFWPSWIADEFKDLAIYSLAYQAEPSELQGSAMTLLDRGQNILSLLRVEDRLSKAPIAFVCHSLGGLVLKQFLRHAKEQETRDRNVAQLLDRVAQVAFLATPHSGSKLPIIVHRFRWLFRPTVIVKDLTAGDPALNDLFRWYTNFCDPRDRLIEHRVFCEKKLTHGEYVVDDMSANPGVAGAEWTPVDADHVGICKPRDRGSLVYKTIRALLQKLPRAQPQSRYRAVATPSRSANPIDPPARIAKPAHEGLPDMVLCRGPDPDLGIPACTRIIDSGEQDRERLAEALKNRGEFFRRKGQVEEALTDCNRAVSIAPAYAPAYLARGLVYRTMRKFDEALGEFNHAIALNKQYANAYDLIGTEYRDKGDHQRAIENYDHAIQLKPDHFWAYYNRGFTYAQLGKFDQAIADYSKTLEYDPGFTAAYTHRGLALEATAQRALAIADYRKAASIPRKHSTGQWGYDKARERLFILGESATS